MIEIEKVQSVYSGKNGQCCCGCAGKHYYASQYQISAGHSRGYKVDDDEVSDRMVKKVVKILNDDSIPVDIDEGTFISKVVGQRLYIAYYVEENLKKCDSCLLNKEDCGKFNTCPLKMIERYDRKVKQAKEKGRLDQHPGHKDEVRVLLERHE